MARRGRSSWRGWRARGGWPPLQRREGRPLPPPRPPPLRAASFAQRRACAWECPSVGPTAGVGLQWARPAGRQGWRTPGTSSAPALRPLPSPPPRPCSCADGQTRACAPPSGQSVPHRRPARATDRQGCRRPQPPLPPPLSLPPRSSPASGARPPRPTPCAPPRRRAPASARRSACAWARCQSWRRWMVPRAKAPRATAPRARAPQGCPRPPAAPAAELAPRAGVAGAAPLTAPPRPSPWRAPPPRAAPRRLPRAAPPPRRARGSGPPPPRPPPRGARQRRSRAPEWPRVSGATE